VNQNIFRSYDIRGIYGEDINEIISKGIGNALGRYSKEDIVVAIDMRKSSGKMKPDFIEGITSSGKNVLDIGLVPLGAAVFFAWKNRKTLAYMTASHLPSEWAGIKFFHSDGTGFMESENYSIRNMFLGKEFFVYEKKGEIEEISNRKIIEEYINYLLSKIKLNKKLKINIDCGNGMSSLLAPELFRKAGCEVDVIYGDLDEKTERNPEPNLDPLIELTNKTKGADIGIAYDGDADRMILVSDKGEILTPEKTSFLILSSIEEEGPVVANVECSKTLDKISKKEIIRIPVGHTFLADYASKKKACFGVESSGHYIIPSVVPYDDALAVSFFACYAVAKSGKKLSEIVKDVPVYPFERVNVECDDGKKFDVIKNLKQKFSEKYENISTMDGIRIELESGWVLIRASNTSPIIRLTVEAYDKKNLEKLRDLFKRELEKTINSA
jgi:phosphomannomutase